MKSKITKVKAPRGFRGSFCAGWNADRLEKIRSLGLKASDFNSDNQYTGKITKETKFQNIYVYIFEGNKKIGYCMLAKSYNGSFHTHSNLESKYRGRGLDVALYSKGN